MTTPNSAPTVNSAEVALLEAILSTGEWMHARDIAVHWRWQEKFPQRQEQPRQAWLNAQERKIRAVASASAGSVLSWPGSQGYRLTLAATEEERQMAIAKLRHQSMEMHARASAIEKFITTKTESQLALV